MTSHHIEKYSNTERTKVIWKKLGLRIIRAFQTNFKDETTQLKHRFKKIRKMSLEYVEDLEEFC